MPKKNLSLLQKDFISLNNKYTTGFTFIEAMVAISLLMTSVAITVTVIRTDILVSSITQNAVIARFLAQEGIEYTRHVRDSRLVKFKKADDSTHWLETLEACFDSTPCIIDTAYPLSVNVTSYPVGGCPVLKYNETENRYGYGVGDDWKDTVFVREIEIVDPGIGTMDTEAIVTVKVVWSERDGSSREVTYQQNLFNWIQ